MRAAWQARSSAVVEFWQWLTENRIEIVPFDAVRAYEAAAAFDRYGKDCIRGRV
ncbi:MAG TPA: hypothetical protein VGO49_15310 [Bradyrhizobium sp.]|nr:hypothetical protein [Bradyrhizobium sp.]